MGCGRTAACRTRAKQRVALLLVGNGFLAGVGAEEAGDVSNGSWFIDHTAESFSNQEAAQQAIAPQRIDADLLDAAVFHETNRRRQRHGLPPLGFDARAREAARLQSAAMAEHEFVGHENPFDAELRTPMDRAQRAGLAPKFLAENVANAFLRAYEEGARVHVRTENGKRILSEQPDGPPIPMQDYVGFAAALLDNWMASPGHRKNILHSAPEYLGSACSTKVPDAPMPKLSCTQIFFTPLPDR